MGLYCLMFFSSILKVKSFKNFNFLILDFWNLKAMARYIFYYSAKFQRDIFIIVRIS